ncbi:MAG: DUF2256 domain-containing protein [Pseudomonadales bacterium]|nr:DUF2256 domain-containing protein [Pseudomonadales bacterium]
MKNKPSSSPSTRGRHRLKRDLPRKLCPVCDRPFTWRRKWQLVWEDVRYCSERCRRQRRQSAEV